MSDHRPGLAPPRPGPLARLVASTAGRYLGTEPLRVFTELGRNRRVFRAWLPFGAVLLFRPSLPRREVELVILRTASNCSCGYEWAHHASLSGRYRISADALDAISDWQHEPEVFSPRERSILGAADELHRARTLQQETRDQLAEILTHEEVIELCMLVGQYEMLAMTLNALGVEPEARTTDIQRKRSSA